MDKKGFVTIDTTTGILKLGDNDKVIFDEIERMTELNKWEPIIIKVLTNNSLKIGDTSNFSEYISGGIMTQIKQKKEYHFTSLKERFDIPYTEEEGLPDPTDISKSISYEIIHIRILSLNKFYQENNNLPELNNKEHSKKLISYAKEIYSSKKNEDLFWFNGLEEEIDDFGQIFEKTILKLSLWSRAQVSPISTFLGGISSQEIVKYTGKHNPIHHCV